MATVDPRPSLPGPAQPAVTVPGGPDVAAFDVVGVGALNVDYRPRVDAATATAVVARVRAVLQRAGMAYRAGTEQGLTPPVMKQVLQALRVPLRPCPGGSAFNAIVAMARAMPALRLGYVGVAGYMHATETLVGLADLQALNVDTGLVKPDQATLAGVCLCLPDGAERTLLTCPGANLGMARHLATGRGDIVDYLSHARIIHVTSLLDAASTVALHRVLTAARQANPALLVSIDPGQVWADRANRNTTPVVDLADVLIVNQIAFRALGGGGSSPRASAEGLLRRLHPRAIVVVKHPHGTTVWRRDADTVIHQDWAQRRLPDRQIVEPTAAGDVFAAGLLAGLLRDRPGASPDLHDPGSAVRLGQAMAHRSLRGQVTGPDDIPDLAATPAAAAGPA
jgi:ribokinase